MSGVLTSIIKLLGTPGKAITVTQDTALDEAVAMSSKLTIPGAWTAWTPTIVDTANNASLGQTYAAVTYGSYLQVGKLIFFHGYVLMTGLGTLEPTARMHIMGLPFVGLAAKSPSVTVGYAAGLAVTAGVSLAGYQVTNTNRIAINKWNITSGTSELLISELSADGGLMFSGFYEAA